MEIIATLTGLFCTVVSSVVTFFLTRRKYNTEVDSQQIRNMSEAFETYKGMMEDTVSSLNRRVESLQKENDALRNQFTQLQTQTINILLGKKLGLEVPDNLNE